MAQFLAFSSKKSLLPNDIWPNCIGFMLRLRVRLISIHFPKEKTTHEIVTTQNSYEKNPNGNFRKINNCIVQNVLQIGLVRKVDGGIMK